ncbi:MAG: hypothetical protein NC033_04315 [Clostridiales bacterium]|nr:hypothetical protein [Clostridiales bacterium]
MTKAEAYKSLLNSCGLTEEQFLEIYNLHGKGTGEYFKAIHKLPKETQAKFPHLFVAYRLLLQEQGKL